MAEIIRLADETSGGNSIRDIRIAVAAATARVDIEDVVGVGAVGRTKPQI